MKKIGGFFELEIANGSSLYHDTAIKLATGRACLNYILKSKKPSKVYLPYYCCDALFEPMVLNGIEFEFYHINYDFEIINPPSLKINEVVIVCNFFGIKSNYTNCLIEKYKEKIIVDDTHSYFKTNEECHYNAFTSARKYFGVPDGAFLYLNEEDKISIKIERNTAISINHNLHSLLSLQEKAYTEYVNYEKSLDSKISGISLYSEKVLKTLNYKEIRNKRNENFHFLKEELRELNVLKISEGEEDCFCYPLLLEKPINKQKLYLEKIFVPNYWLDVLNREQNAKYKIECKLSKEILPLPIDHRYTTKDLIRVCNTIKKMINEK